MSQYITVVGAGLSGSLMALYLAKRGFFVDIYESRPDMRKQKMSAGRSINLALSKRGIDALAGVGLAEKVLKNAIPMRGRKLHAANGDLSYQPYSSREDEYINSVSRGELNKILMDEAEAHPKVKMHFNFKCTGMDFIHNQIRFESISVGKKLTISPDTVIAADGSNSAVRASMIRLPRYSYYQNAQPHGYKELVIPPLVSGVENAGFSIEKEALHIWPRKSYMLIALPNADGSFTCTLFMPHEGKVSFASLNSDKKIKQFFKENFADALKLMPTLVNDFNRNPTGNLTTIKCNPWHVNGQAVLIGDAAHAVVPFYGQGMNASFEDCLILDDCIGEIKDSAGGDSAKSVDWEEIYKLFGQKRIKDGHAIAELAERNYITMRDSVADPVFLLAKKVEAELERRFPSQYATEYTMVTFQRVPYAEAQSKGKKQTGFIYKHCKKVGEFDKVDWELLATNLI